MSFNYDKFKKETESETPWASQSDLFTCLAFIFLLLYVVTSLRSGTFGIQKASEYQRLAEENEDLKQQIKVYNTLREDYVEKGASEDEQKVYKELMGQLDLLQDKAKEEKLRLRQEAVENERKEIALNKYQQLVRNILNANMMAQARIKQREEKIQEVKEEGQEKLSKLERRRREELKRLEQEKLQKIAMLEEQSTRKISELQEESEKIAQELNEKRKALSSATSKLSQVQSQVEKSERDKSQLVSQLQQLQEKYTQQKQEMEAEFDQRQERERKEFENRLEQEKLSKAAREMELERFKQQAERNRQAHDLQVAALQSKITASQIQLKKAQDLANARKNLASQIKRNFDKYGIKAAVDPGTGDVILDFKDEYFDTGRADLKPRMREILNQLIPIYSKSLFESRPISEKLNSVEIVGFASPTYQGKFVDPNSIDTKDRAALQYNLDLSYSRARSIFNHITDSDKLSYENQRDLMRIMKVSGRSFLAEEVKSLPVHSGMSQKEFCKVYDCRKAQRVIIKFNLKD